MRTVQRVEQGDSASFDTRRALARAFAACRAQGLRLVVVDDLQFADDLSVEAIAVVVGGGLTPAPVGPRAVAAAARAVLDRIYATEIAGVAAHYAARASQGRATDDVATAARAGRFSPTSPQAALHAAIKLRLSIITLHRKHSCGSR